MKKTIILIGFLLASRCAFAILAHLVAGPVAYGVTVCAANCCIEEHPPQGSVRADKHLGRDWRFLASLHRR